MGRPVGDPKIVAAIVAAVAELVKDAGGQKGVAKSVGVTQQTISAALRHRKVGFDLLLGVARAYQSTIDEVIARFGGYPGERVGYRARDTNGWEQARAVAEEHASVMGQPLPGWAWEMAGSVKLPLRPRHATPKLVTACALVVLAAGDVSGERPSVAPRLESTD